MGEIGRLRKREMEMFDIKYVSGRVMKTQRKRDMESKRERERERRR